MNLREIAKQEVDLQRRVDIAWRWATLAIAILAAIGSLINAAVNLCR